MKDNIKEVPIKLDDESLEAAEFLKGKMKQTRTGAVRWAVIDTAERLGYVPNKTAPHPKTGRGRK